MRVRTIRRHGNAHPPKFTKHPGRIYDLPEREAHNLAKAGLVEIDEDRDKE